MSADPWALNESLNIERLAIGDNKALIIDNFLKHPEAMVQYAAQSKYEVYPGYQERKGYPGIRAKAPEDYSYNITMYLDPIIKEEFGVPEQLDIRKSICGMSLTTMPPEHLGPLQNTPHFDASTPNHIAVLLYLCGKEHGGTAFYRHNATGYEQITEQNREHYLDVYFEEINKKRPENTYFNESNETFTKIAHIEAKYNRLVLYKGSLLHTAVVNPEKSVSTNPNTGRLTVNTFYDF